MWLAFLSLSQQAVCMGALVYVCVNVCECISHLSHVHIPGVALLGEQAQACQKQTAYKLRTHTLIERGVIKALLKTLTDKRSKPSPQI